MKRAINSKPLASPQNLHAYAEPTGTPCGEMAEGVLDADGMLCCPKGCGTCGGPSCSTIPISWVMPESPLVTPLALQKGVQRDATSAGELVPDLAHRMFHPG